MAELLFSGVVSKIVLRLTSSLITAGLKWVEGDSVEASADVDIETLQWSGDVVFQASGKSSEWEQVPIKRRFRVLFAQIPKAREDTDFEFRSRWTLFESPVGDVGRSIGAWSSDQATCLYFLLRRALAVAELRLTLAPHEEVFAQRSPFSFHAWVLHDSRKTTLIYILSIFVSFLSSTLFVIVCLSSN